MPLLFARAFFLQLPLVLFFEGILYWACVPIWQYSNPVSFVEMDATDGCFQKDACALSMVSADFQLYWMLAAMVQLTLVKKDYFIILLFYSKPPLIKSY